MIFILIAGHPFSTFASTESKRNQKSELSTDLNLTELPRLSPRYLQLTNRNTPPEKYSFFGLRIMSQGGGYRIPGLNSATNATSSFGYSPVEGVTASMVLGGELSHVIRPMGMSFIFDVAPIGMPISGSSSISSQLMFKLGIHYYSIWFNRPSRFSFIYCPYTVLIARYQTTSIAHGGFGFGFEAQVEGPKWGDRLVNWLFSVNWNRMGSVNGSIDSIWVMAGEGGTAQMIYALVGMEMNFSVR